MTNIIEIAGYAMSRKDKRRRRKMHQPSQPRSVGTAVIMPKPKDWGGIDPAAMGMPSNSDVTADRDFSGRVSRAMRYDVFSLLFYTPQSRLAPTSYDAVRRLQADMAILHRTQGAMDVQRTTGSGQTGALAVVTEDFSITRVLAGKRVEQALHGWHRPGDGMWVAGMEPWAARLIRDLCEPEIINGQRQNWHAVVTRHTGEMDRHERGKIVRTACDDLAESYRRIDNEPKRAVG